MQLFTKLFKKHRLLFIIGLVLIVALTGFFILRGKTVNASGTASQQRTATATLGELSVTLSASGTVSPVNRKEIRVVINGVISESYLEEGKSFKKGDVLVKFNDSDAQLSVKKLENSLKQKELSVSTVTLKNGAMDIPAPFTGRIKGLSVKEGDEVNNGATLMTIVDESILQTQVVFENATTEQFKGITTLQIQIPDFMATLTGKIQSLSQDGNNLVAMIFINNPGALTSGLSAWADIETASGTLTSTQGTLEFVTQKLIKAEVAGTIINLSALNDLKVSKGKSLLSITDEALPYTMESQQLSLEQAQVELKLANEKLENYTIKAPFDGVAVSVPNLDPGDSIESGTSIAILMDTKEMTFQMSIDELDISTVKIGQTVNVTADALEDEKMVGKVTAIAPEGQTSNGVTNYAVTVTIPGMDNLKSGMNVDAVIIILSKSNAMLVPIEAVQKQGNGYIVRVLSGQQGSTNTSSGAVRDTENNPVRGQIGGKVPAGMDFQNMTAEERQAYREKMGSQGPAQSITDDSTQTGAKVNTQNIVSDYYSGTVAVKVKVGQHNETYMEITEGLNEGDIVVLPPLVANSTTNSSTKQIQGNSIMPIGGGSFIREAQPNIKRGN